MSGRTDSIDARLRRRRDPGEGISPVELTRAYLERIERLDERLNSYITVCHAEAMKAAREAERAVMAGEAWDRCTGCRWRQGPV